MGQTASIPLPNDWMVDANKVRKNTRHWTQVGLISPPVKIPGKSNAYLLTLWEHEGRRYVTGDFPGAYKVPPG